MEVGGPLPRGLRRLASSVQTATGTARTFSRLHGGKRSQKKSWKRTDQNTGCEYSRFQSNMMSRKADQLPEPDNTAHPTAPASNPPASSPTASTARRRPAPAWLNRKLKAQHAKAGI